MSVFSAIKAYFAKSVEVTEVAEERASNSTSGITAEEELLLRTALSGGGATNLTSAEALEIPAFSSAIDFVASTIAMLPIKLYKENRSEMTTEEVTDDIRLKLLNDETGDTLNPFEMKKALISDMFTEGKGYIYIERKGNTVKSLRYVESSNVSSQKGIDPIFKVVDIMISGKRYNTWDFIIMTRKTRDGVTGTGLVSEHKLILSAAYNMLRLENNMATCGGSKKGFLESEKQLTDEALTKLKKAWNELYSSPDNRAIVLNNGVKFHEGSNSAVDLQLNQNKITNSDQITMLVGLSPKIISGNATEEEYMNAVRTAIVPIVVSFQTAINRALLLESEKSDMYFVVDYAELMKGDIRSRYEAYRIGLEANFLQPDEVRYMEDLKPLGLEFIKLGLNDVLYDTKTKEFYTPNTNQHAKMGEKPLQTAGKGDIIQGREYIQDPETGLMMGSTPEGGESSSDVDGGESPGKSETSKPSATGANKFTVRAFKSKQQLQNHWNNGRTHQAEYAEDGIFTAKEYEQRALELIESPCGDTILGYANGNGAICRYDVVKNDYVKGNPSKGVFTMFKPEKGRAYFDEMKKKEGINDE